MQSPLTHHEAIRVLWLGENVEYGAGMAVMRRAMEDVDTSGAQLLLLEHAPTITVTRQGGLSHLLASPDELHDDGIGLVETDRGGNVTFHGPGQLVGYPVVRLRAGSDGRADLVGYLRALERGLIEACARLGVRGCHRKEGMTGVWVASDPDLSEARWATDERAAKLVAVGVGVGRGVTRHGFALNVGIDLARFTRRIVPCGLVGRPVTSLIEQLGEGAVPDDDTLRRVVAESVASALGLLPRFSAPLLGSSASPSAGVDTASVDPVEPLGEGVPSPRRASAPEHKDGAFHG